jgi:hypothetical protein
MSLFLPALAVAFAALFVWLGVRIINRPAACAKQTVLVLTVLRSSFKRTLPWGIALAGTVVGVLWLVVEPSYRASALIAISPYPFRLNAFTEHASADDAASAVELLQSPFLISLAIESEDLRQLTDLHTVSAREDPIQRIGPSSPLSGRRRHRPPTCERRSCLINPQDECALADTID